MRSPIVFMVALAALGGCSETVSTTAPDAADVVDASDVVDADDVVDAGDVVDASDVVDAMDVPRPDVGADVPLDAGVRCGLRETACVSAGVLTCTNIDSDTRHCGGCGRACCPGQFCAIGACVTGCPAGMTACTPAGATCPFCVDIQTSSAHCGRCNLACADGQVCARGECVAPACAAVTEPPPPMGQCDGRGRIACERWAQDLAGGRPTVTAQCLTSPSGCAKADRCDDPRDPATCRCGAEPSCGPNQVCELVGPTARCRCALP